MLAFLMVVVPAFLSPTAEVKTQYTSLEFSLAMFFVLGINSDSKRVQKHFIVHFQKLECTEIKQLLEHCENCGCFFCLKFNSLQSVSTH